MPIKACSDKLKQEMQDFGCPPQFPQEDPAKAPVEEEEAKIPVDLTKKAKKGKSKVLAKSSSLTYQWQIMRSLGLTDEEVKRSAPFPSLPRFIIHSEIPRFADPAHWLECFPPHTMADLKALGASVSGLGYAHLLFRPHPFL